jgi:hypothetical protein
LYISKVQRGVTLIHKVYTRERLRRRKRREHNKKIREADH